MGLVIAVSARAKMRNTWVLRFAQDDKVVGV